MFSILSKKLADIGFYINLDSSNDRREFIENHAKDYKIEGLNRFTALTDELRQYACTKSHRAIFEYCLNNSIDSVFVAEDDFCLYPNIKVGNAGYLSIRDAIDNLPDISDYDVVMFGCNPKKQLIPINSKLAYNISSTGAWSYIIKKTAMKYILENYNYYRDYAAIDDILPSLNYKGFKTVVTVPQLINHRDGITSTLQPHVGTTHYSTWINGNWDRCLYDKLSYINSYSQFEKHLESNYIIEKNITVFITGHAAPNWLLYLRYLLKSLPKSLLNCRFLICYDSFSNDDKFNLSRYFRDVQGDLQPSIEYVTGGLISSLKRGLSLIQTDYFLWLEHDWVFLKDDIDFEALINAMNSNSFINSVWFNKDDNNPRGFDICHDSTGSSPYELEDRVSDISLIITCRWSNNPVLHRTSKMKKWFDQYINNEYVDQVNQRSHNIEEKMINTYRGQIEQLGWRNIKDEWGTYLYGNLNEGPFVAHTDATKRYTGESRSIPEINGENYINNNPLTENE